MNGLNFNSKRNWNYLIVFVIFKVYISILASQSSAAPGVMNHQGRLTDSGGIPIAAATNVTFTFWDTDIGGSQIGSFSDTDSVTPDSNGLYSTLIGDDPGNLVPASVFAGDSVWLNVNVGGEDLLPRQRVTAAAYALNSGALGGYTSGEFLKLDNPAFVVVPTTDSATLNSAALLAAYAKAKGLTPHGAALSATNRAAVIVLPGKYDLGTGELTLDTEFVDLIGLSTKHTDQIIVGETGGDNTGVLRQTANDIGIENLLVQSTRSSGIRTNDNVSPAAYFPDSNLPATVIRNCEFRDDGAEHSWSMRTAITYSGRYVDCIAGSRAFGGNGGMASGIFIDCTGGFATFGAGGTANGTFINCTGGNSAFGAGGTAIGTFTNCDAGSFAFGGGIGGTASGIFSNCTGGSDSFGGYDSTASGKFTDCTGSSNSFGGGGVASGTFTNCTGSTNSFGGNFGNSTGAKLFGCRLTGSWSGTFTGRMQDCYWATGITLGAAARIYNSTFLGDVDLNNTAAGIANSYINDQILNAGSAAFNSGNVEDADVN